MVGKILSKDGKFHLPFISKASLEPEPRVSIFYVTIYGRCGDQVVEIDSALASEVPQVKAIAGPRWELVEESQGTLRFEEVIDDYCGTHKRCRLITIYRGHVAVFRGREPDPSYLLQERADLREGELQPRDREYVKKGHVIEAGPEIPPQEVGPYLEQAVALWLEGLMEH